MAISKFIKSIKSLSVFSLLYLLFFAFLLFSCPGAENEYSDVDIDKMAEQAEVTTPAKVEEAIDLVTDCFERSKGQKFTSFVIKGESQTQSDDGWDYESTILVKFDGNNTFYRKDDIQSDGSAIESWEEYNPNSDDTNNLWAITTKINDGTGPEKSTNASSEIYSLYSCLSSLKSQIKSATPNDKNLYNITYNGNPISLGFKGNRLIYLEIVFDYGLPSEIAKAKYVLAFLDYGKSINITLPE